MKAKSIALAAAAVIAALISTKAWAESPTPEVSATAAPTASATSPALQGVVYTLEVLDERGTAVPDGTVIEFINAALRPPANADEVRNASNHEPCAQSEVHNGVAEVVAEFGVDCPQGADIAPTIFLPGETTGMVYEATPPIEWREARVQGERLSVQLKPVPPPSGGDTGTVRPPNTGDAALQQTASPSTFNLEYAAFGLAALLAIASLALAVMQKKRSRQS
jgi:hypothetical protein